MTDIVSIPIQQWHRACSPHEQEAALRALEAGHVVLLPQLGFPLHDTEQPLLASTTVGSGKNISLNPSNGQLSGCSADAATRERLRSMTQRYASSGSALVGHLLPGYAPSIRAGRTSFRPVEIAGRPTSWRKDDTRLHVDSFPSSPTRGQRILRLFTNVHPGDQSRTWRLGEPFENVVRRYLTSLQRPVWGTSQLLNLLGITKGRRSAYDHFMLQLHDRMKADTPYQVQAPQHTQQFLPGSSWLVYTDQVSHAAMAGQYAFEQTFYLPVDAMGDASKSPLQVLERLLRRKLV